MYLQAKVEISYSHMLQKPAKHNIHVVTTYATTLFVQIILWSQNVHKQLSLTSPVFIRAILIIFHDTLWADPLTYKETAFSVLELNMKCGPLGWIGEFICETFPANFALLRPCHQQSSLRHTRARGWRKSMSSWSVILATRRDVLTKDVRSAKDRI